MIIKGTGVAVLKMCVSEFCFAAGRTVDGQRGFSWVHPLFSWRPHGPWLLPLGDWVGQGDGERAIQGDAESSHRWFWWEGSSAASQKCQGNCTAVSAYPRSFLPSRPVPFLGIRLEGTSSLLWLPLHFSSLEFPTIWSHRSDLIPPVSFACFLGHLD